MADATDPKITADDVEGHSFRGAAEADLDETDDTTEHGFRGAADAESDEDDVEGHVRAR